MAPYYLSINYTFDTDIIHYRKNIGEYYALRFQKSLLHTLFKLRERESGYGINTMDCVIIP